MQLTDLEPRWFSHDASNEIHGLSFLCPHCKESRLGILFSHSIAHDQPVPTDDSITHLPRTEHVWQITGDTPTFDGEKHGGFENITLLPSVDESASGHWHGFITNGVVTTV
jgi:hypothetical protein